MTIMDSFVYEFDREQAENTKCAEKQKNSFPKEYVKHITSKIMLKMQFCSSFKLYYLATKK